MTLGAWFVFWLICAIAGTKAISGIRHYMAESNDDKSTIKIFDLTVSVVLGLIPGLNVLLSFLFTIMALFFIIMEIYSFHGDFFQKDLFPKKKSDKTKDEY